MAELLMTLRQRHGLEALLLCGGSLLGGLLAVGAGLALGLLVSLEARCGAAASRTLLLLSTGFLGSFSTFSTWMAELLMTLRQRQGLEALLLCGGSLLGGLLAVGAGLALGSA